MMSLLLSWWVLAAVLSTILTAVVRRYALENAILDVPVERSSHSVPTPSGGGVAIALVVLGGLLSLGVTGALDPGTTAALVGGSAFIGWIGWLDDRMELPASLRLGVHVIAALWFLGWVGWGPRASIAGVELGGGIPGSGLAVLLIVWFVNLYNFMDGIDGLAGGEAVAVGLLAGILSLLTGHTDLALVCLILSGASLGFLFWNWSPAKIFMGDAGSGMLGFLFAALALLSEARGAVPLVVWVVLLGVFIFDATVTLLRRMVRGEQWRQAHRSHGYQRATLALGGHARVVAGSLVLTMILGALAAWAMLLPEHQLVVIGAAASLLTLVYRWIEARAPMPGSPKPSDPARRPTFEVESRVP